MQNRYTQFVLTLVAIIFTFSSCKKEYSPDEPLEETFTPTVFIGSQNQHLYALDPVTGIKKWEFFTGGSIYGSPMVLKDWVFVPTENGRIFKLDAKHGTLIKTYVLEGQILATPTSDGDYMYIGAGDNNMYAFDIIADTLEWKAGVGAGVFSSAIIFDTVVLFGCNDGKVYGLDKENGVQIWTFDPGTGGPFISSPAIADTFVYIGGLDGRMYKFNVFNQNVEWQYQTSGSILSSPVLVGGNCIFGSNDNNLYCIDVIAGLPRWDPIPLKERITSSPFFHDQTIFVGSYDFNMYAINVIDGTIRWTTETKGLIKSSPLVFDNQLYFGSYDKFLYCVDPLTGNINWKQNINGLIECSPAVDKLDGKSNYTSTISGNSPY